MYKRSRFFGKKFTAPGAGAGAPPVPITTMHLHLGSHLTTLRPCSQLGSRAGAAPARLVARLPCKIHRQIKQGALDSPGGAASALDALNFFPASIGSGLPKGGARKSFFSLLGGPTIQIYIKI